MPSIRHHIAAWLRQLATQQQQPHGIRILSASCYVNGIAVPVVITERRMAP